MTPSLRDVEHAIERFAPDEQQQLLAELPHLLKMPLDDLGRLKLAERSFAFWENADDAIYDTL